MSKKKGARCPKCNQSKLEKEIEKLLAENNINFEQQKKFDWLGRQSLDFLSPTLNIAIECQGIQHFRPSILFGNEEYKKQLQEINLKKIVRRK